MCGIMFLFNQELTAENIKQIASKALDQIKHRGPDAEGVICGSGWVMGHRRLSIIDLLGSKQPMLDPQKRYSLSYNGEIYNYKSLRKQLENNWQFKTHGDTEVILAGLIIHGKEFLSKLEGMWAIAFWDNIESKLLLSRDRLGKKPLYYTNNNGLFACASELPSLLTLSQHHRQEDLDSTADYFRYGFFLPGTTIYKGVKEVLPGHHLEWSTCSAVSTEQYWQIPTGKNFKNKRQGFSQLRDVLIESVEKRMVADVEVGAFLSGGVDSSLIVSIMCNDLGIHPQTFTIGFDEKAYDESVYAKQISNWLGTEHHQETHASWDKKQLLLLILKHVGQPFCDSSLLPTAQVSSLASRHVKVVLSGDGSDELFSGYQRYQARAILQWFTRLPEHMQSLVIKTFDVLPEPATHHSKSMLKKAHLFSNFIKRKQAETPYVAPVFYSNDEYKLLAPDLFDKGHSPPSLPSQTRLDDIEKMMLSDCLVYMPQDILTKVDRASMAYSLETRAPFLDAKVVEAAFSMPVKWHRRGFSGKRSLRQTFSDRLPVNIWNRNKQGFAVPVHDWFRNEAGEHLSVMLKMDTGPLCSGFIYNLLEQHQNKISDHGYKLWAIYVYLLWRNET